MFPPDQGEGEKGSVIILHQSSGKGGWEKKKDELD